jgi:hypothetical protein
MSKAFVALTAWMFGAGAVVSLIGFFLGAPDTFHISLWATILVGYVLNLLFAAAVLR